MTRRLERRSYPPKKQQALRIRRQIGTPDAGLCEEQAANTDLMALGRDFPESLTILGEPDREIRHGDRGLRSPQPSEFTFIQCFLLIFFVGPLKRNIRVT